MAVKKKKSLKKKSTLKNEPKIDYSKYTGWHTFWEIKKIASFPIILITGILGFLGYATYKARKVIKYIFETIIGAYNYAILYIIPVLSLFTLSNIIMINNLSTVTREKLLRKENRPILIWYEIFAFLIPLNLFFMIYLAINYIDDKNNLFGTYAIFTVVMVLIDFLWHIIDWLQKTDNGVDSGASYMLFNWYIKKQDEKKDGKR